jgi:hypothetical protein
MYNPFHYSQRGKYSRILKVLKRKKIWEHTTTKEKR